MLDLLVLSKTLPREMSMTEDERVATEERLTAANTLQIDDTSMENEHKRGYGRVFASGEFRALFIAFLMEMLGNVLVQLALTVIIYQRSHSPFLASLTFSVLFLPNLIAGAFLSALVDRLSARRLLILGNIFSAVLVVVMTIPTMPSYALLLILFGMSFFAPLSFGARGALIPNIVEPDLVIPARSLLRVVMQSSLIGGFVAGGVALTALSPFGVLCVDAVGLSVGAIILALFLKPHSTTHGKERTILADSLAGLGLALRVAKLRTVLLFGWLVPLLLVIPEGLAAPAVSARDLSPSAIGWWLAALPTGTVVGEIFGIAVISPARISKMIPMLTSIGFAALAVFILHPPFFSALVLMALCGLCGAAQIGLDRLLIAATPPGHSGRVYTVQTSGQSAFQGVGFAGAGLLGSVLSTDAVIALAGILGIVVCATLSPVSTRCLTPV